MAEKQYTVLIYKMKVEDKKHNITFDKDKIFYNGKTHDLVIKKACRPLIESALASGLQYPLQLTLTAKDYFAKPVSFTRNDGTKGLKFKIVLQNAPEITQGEFASKSLDDINEELDAHKVSA